MNLFGIKEYSNRVITILLFSVLIALPMTGSDCEKALVSNGNVPQQMVGNWKLVEQTGALFDICSDETINFQVNGVAVLTCPNSNSISRDFRVENDVLTYSQTSVAYTIQTLTNDSLYLLGQNVSRNLRYLKIITYNEIITNGGTAGLKNSSEVRR